MVKKTGVLNVQSPVFFFYTEVGRFGTKKTSTYQLYFPSSVNRIQGNKKQGIAPKAMGMTKEKILFQEEENDEKNECNRILSGTWSSFE